MKPIISQDVYEMSCFQELCHKLGIDTTESISLSLHLSVDEPVTYTQTKYADTSKED